MIRLPGGPWQTDATLDAALTPARMTCRVPLCRAGSDSDGRHLLSFPQARARIARCHGQRAAPRFTINGVMTPQAPRPGRRRHKKLRNRLRSRASLAIAAAVGLALIVGITLPALLAATSASHGRKPAPTVTVMVPVPQPAVTFTVLRPGPTVTVTELQPGPTVTVQCRHPGRHCGGG
jgi:hypothetical protein